MLDPDAAQQRMPDFMQDKMVFADVSIAPKAMWSVDEPDIMDPGLTWQAVVARLHPGARPAALSTGEPGRLARSTLAISRRLYDCPGCQPD